MKNICEKCKEFLTNKKSEVFFYFNKPYSKREIAYDIQGWGAFPNKVYKLTDKNGEITYTSIDSKFSNTPTMEYASHYIIRKSKPKEILEIYEAMRNGYIVTNGKKFFYIPKYKDLLSLGEDKNYKHPELLSANSS